MRRHVILVSVSCVCILALLTLSTLPVLGTPAYQLDPTDQQATVDAIVDERFTQTAIAITEAPTMPTTVSTVAPTPIPTLTLMPTALAEGSQPFFIGSLSTVFSYTVNEDTFDEYQDGWEEFFGRDFDDAIDDFTDAIDEDPTFAEAYYSRAVAHMANGNYDETLEDIATFESITGRIDHEVLLSQVFAQANNNSADIDIIIQDSIRLLAIPPYDYYIVELLMQTYIDNGDYAEAVAVGDAMLPYFYYINDFFDLRHDAYDGLGDDANADFNDAVHDGLDDLTDNDIDSAEDNFEEALEIAQDENLSDRDLAFAYYNLALVSLFSGEFNDAVDYLNDSLDADITLGISHTLRGIYYGITSNEELELFNFTQGIEQAPDSFNNYIQRAVAYNERGSQQAGALDAQQWLSLTQRHLLQWELETLNGEELLLPLFLGWSHQFELELEVGDTLNISAQMVGSDIVNPFILILDPSGNPIISDISAETDITEVEIDDYRIQDAGRYTIIFGNSFEENTGLIEVEIEID